VPSNFCHAIHEDLLLTFFSLTLPVLGNSCTPCEISFPLLQSPDWDVLVPR